MKQLVFLGGTAANNNWRQGFIQKLVDGGIPQDWLFNPVVPNWTPECQAKEEEAKGTADYLVFYIASPQQDGNPLSAYSMVEAAMVLYDRSDKAVVVFDKAGMDGHPLKAMNQTEKVLRARHPRANIFSTPDESIDWLKSRLIHHLHDDDWHHANPGRDPHE